MTKTHVTPNGATLTLDDAYMTTGIKGLSATRDPNNGKWMLLVDNLGMLADIVDAYYPQWKAQQAANQPRALIRHLERKHR